MNPIDILHLSDTHGQHKNLKSLPEADVIVHSGDFTFAGSEEEAYDFMNWFCNLPYKHKIFIAGNHDMCMYGADHIDGLSRNVHYLYNNSVVIDGIKFYGIPMFMEDCMDGNLDVFINNIPDDTDVLITHMPPKGTCDLADYGKGPEHRGNATLAELLKKLHPTCHLFGHEHDAYGKTIKENVIYSNACVVDSRYNLINNPTIININHSAYVLRGL
ncbi:metallophosphoesterase [uncultured Prevotella sp.]|uniref:metallophosphoesterase family protein n=1 Tax=uncultured Prevotella sp. TaxID=159272 RepID=UPI0027E2554A|nr:metallophosphoesterase [uncultured Prevotella sp.]